VTRVVHTSTSEVYGTPQYAPIDERHPVQPQSPYSATKAGADMLALSYHSSFGLPVVVVRPFNTYGPRQSARAVIPVIMSHLHLGAAQLTLRSLPPTRDFNFVRDTVAGMMSVAACSQAVGHVVNVGSGREISTRDLVELMMTVTGKKAEVVQDPSRVRPADSEVD
jgi:nucleoside-diphosphate-sugar epimerase